LDSNLREIPRTTCGHEVMLANVWDGKHVILGA
jgi:hypothetical protein